MFAVIAADADGRALAGQAWMAWCRSRLADMVRSAVPPDASLNEMQD
jgi:hypothetical protein